MPTSRITSTTSGQTSLGGLLAGRLGADVGGRVALEERLGHLRAAGVVVADEQHVLHRGSPSRRRAARCGCYPLTIITSIDICRSMAVDLELAPKTEAPRRRALLRAGRLSRRRARAGRAHGRRSPRRSATRSACSSSTCCASTPARSASASWCRCSTSPSPRSRTTSRSCARPGIVDSERRGLWAYYYVLPDALEELSAWLS